MQILRKHGVDLRVVERSDVEAIEVGGFAPNCFGKMSQVVEILARGVDTNDKAFIIYYVHTLNGVNKMSFSLREGEIIKDLETIKRFKGEELIFIEKSYQLHGT